MPAPYDRADFDPFVTFAYEALALTTTAKTLSTAVWKTSSGKPPMMAIITVENQAIRYRADGTAPTSAVGTPVASGTQFVVYGTTDIIAMQLVVGTGGTTATAHVEYFR